MTYNILQAAGTPLTQPEILAALHSAGYKVAPTIIYPLVDLGVIKKSEKDGRMAYSIIPGATMPVSGMGGNGAEKKTRKYNRKKIILATPTPTTPEQLAVIAQEEVGRAHNAHGIIKNTAAMLQFAILLDKMGADQMLLMLSGVEQMASSRKG